MGPGGMGWRPRGAGLGRGLPSGLGPHCRGAAIVWLFSLKMAACLPSSPSLDQPLCGASPEVSVPFVPLGSSFRTLGVFRGVRSKVGLEGPGPGEGVLGVQGRGVGSVRNAGERSNVFLLTCRSSVPLAFL